MNSFCKVTNCECFKQEIPLHLMYWLAHQGIDIRPLFQRPYINNKRKPKLSTTINPENSSNPDNNILDDLMQATWPLQSDLDNIIENSENYNNTSQSNVRRSVPYKIPSSSNKEYKYKKQIKNSM